MYAYSKLRRENANFKINTKVDSEGNPVYVADPSTGSDEPITGLLQILPEGLDCYDFLGMCFEVETTTGLGTAVKRVGILYAIMFYAAGSQIGINADLVLPIDTILLNEDIFYFPSNGYLVDSTTFDISSLAPEGEGGGRVIDLGELQYDSSAGTWSGYETGLQPPDFIGATIIMSRIMSGVRLTVKEVGLLQDSTVIELTALAPGQTTPTVLNYYPANGTFAMTNAGGGGDNPK